MSFLLSHNIQVEVRGEGMFGLQGELPMDDSSLPYIWLIDQHKHDQAKQIIADFELNGNTLANNEWQCSECGEINEGQFALCWQCGHSAS